MKKERPVPAPADDDDDVETAEVVTMAQWLVLMLKPIVPILNIIVLIKTAVGGPKVNRNMTTMMRAQLIYVAIVFVLTFVITAIAGASV